MLRVRRRAPGTYDLVVHGERNELVGRRTGIVVEPAKDPEPIDLSR